MGVKSKCLSTPNPIIARKGPNQIHLSQWDVLFCSFVCSSYVPRRVIGLRRIPTESEWFSNAVPRQFYQRTHFRQKMLSVYGWEMGLSIVVEAGSIPTLNLLP